MLTLPDIGRFTVADLGFLSRVPFSPDGQVFLLPQFTGPKPVSMGGEYRRPIVVCHTATGLVVPTKILADVGVRSR